MVKIIYPASDAIFYITTREPTTRGRVGRAAGQGAGGRRIGEPADDAGPRARPGSLDGRREADARRGPRGVPRRQGEGRRRARRAQRSALHVVHELSSALSHRTTGGALLPADGDSTCLPPRHLRATPAPAAAAAKPRWKAAGSCVRPRICAPTAPWRGCRGARTRRLDRRRARRLLRADHVERHAVVPRRRAGERADEGALLSSYIAYSGPCTIDEAESSVTLKVDAAWQPNYVGTEQKRFFRFENGVAAVRAGARIDPRRKRAR